MAGAVDPLHATEEKKEIWDDVELLRLFQTDKYGNVLSAKLQDRIYGRVRSNRWMGDNLFKLLKRGTLVVVQRPTKSAQISLDTHRGMGHYGVLLLEGHGPVVAVVKALFSREGGIKGVRKGAAAVTRTGAGLSIGGGFCGPL